MEYGIHFTAGLLNGKESPIDYITTVARTVDRLGYTWYASGEHLERGMDLQAALTVAAVELVGGIRAIGHSENLPAERARFIEAFHEVATHRKRMNRMLPAVREFIATGQLPSEGWPLLMASRPADE